MQPSQSSRNLRRLGIIALFAALGVVAIAAVYSVRNWSAMGKARKLKNPVPPTAEAIAAGMQLYGKHCQKCHGENGDGQGEKAAELSVAPGDFTDAQKMRDLTDGELYWQITRGRLPMPAFADKLSQEGCWQLVDYIRTFAQKAPGSPAAQPARNGAPPRP